MLSTAFAALTALAIAVPALGASHGAQHRRAHHDVAKRMPGDVETHQFNKRFDNCRYTFYDVGLGACGEYNKASDFIVALNSAQYGGGYPGPHCFKSITIQVGDKTAQATIMDECPGCPYGGLDMSRGLFTHFASEDKGVISGSWWFNDGSGGGQVTQKPDPPKTTTPPPPPPPKTTKKPDPTPTPPPPPPPPKTSEKPEPTPTPTPPPPPPPPSTSEKPKPSSSSKPPPPPPSSSSSAKPSSSSAKPSSSAAASSSASAAASSAGFAAAAGASPSAPAGLEKMNQAFMGLSGLVVGGGQAM